MKSVVLPYTCLKLHMAGQNFAPVEVVAGVWELQSDTRVLASENGETYKFTSESNAKIWVEANLIRASKKELVRMQHLGKLILKQQKTPRDYLAEEIASMQSSDTYAESGGGENTETGTNGEGQTTETENGTGGESTGENVETPAAPIVAVWDAENAQTVSTTVFSEGDSQFHTNVGGWATILANVGKNSGKWRFAIKSLSAPTKSSSSVFHHGFGLAKRSAGTVGGADNGFAHYHGDTSSRGDSLSNWGMNDGQQIAGNTSTYILRSGSILNVWIDFDAGKCLMIDEAYSSNLPNISTAFDFVAGDMLYPAISVYTVRGEDGGTYKILTEEEAATEAPKGSAHTDYQYWKG